MLKIAADSLFSNCCHLCRTSGVAIIPTEQNLCAELSAPRYQANLLFSRHADLSNPDAQGSPKVRNSN